MFIRTFTGCLMAALAGIGPGMTVATDDPLVRLVAPKDGASACYRRVYDAAHLKRNSRQQTTDILLSFKYQGNNGAHIERIMLTRRERQPVFYFAGSCEWSKTANIDTSGNRMIKSYTKDAGYACIALTGPGSAEEGGAFLIDLAPDGKSAMLHLDGPIYAMRGKDKLGAGKYVKLGSEDRLFRLTRTDVAACRALEEALPDLP